MRYTSLDALRGFALLGLPFLNIISFSMPFATYLNPYAYQGDSLLNHVIFSFIQVVGDQKFYGIFSILFGASIIMLCEKAKSRHQGEFRAYGKRMFWLFVIGLLHLFLLWEGDILSTYAIVGLLVFLFRDLSIQACTFICLLLIACSTVLNLQLDLEPIDLSQSDFAGLRAMYLPTSEDIDNVIQAMRGSYDSVMSATSWASSDQDFVIGDTYLINMGTASLLKIASLMMLGMILFKSGVLLGQRGRELYKKMACYGIALGYISTLLIVVWLYSNQYDANLYFSYGAGLLSLSTYITTVGYVGLVCWLIKSARATRFINTIKPVGRLALTNYLSQSLLCALIFYGYGIGAFGSFNRVELLLTAISIGIAQIGFSHLWLNYFAQGPIEWLWRRLSGTKLPQPEAEIEVENTNSK
ncbi:DUF418 domain-containing protein [Agaribacter flavus]|uniref:DUF418 domain-containing protein n=1 Tax=Agaribacter flavus TaxID=1902781 RepID=A0ABV7FPR8_9ALTE